MSSDGIIYEAMSDGYYKVTDRNNNSRFFGFAMSGKYNNNPFIKTVEDYSWSYAENGGVLTASNGAGWDINFDFNNNRTKILPVITNNYPLSVTNAKFWVLMTIKNGEFLKYDDELIYYNGEQFYKQGDLNSLVPRIEMSNMIFSYQDLIDNGFNITDFYIGDGAIIGYPGVNIMAVGVTKNNGVFPSGVTVVVDPEINATNETSNASNSGLAYDADTFTFSYDDGSTTRYEFLMNGSVVDPSVFTDFQVIPTYNGLKYGLLLDCANSSGCVDFATYFDGLNVYVNISSSFKAIDEVDENGTVIKEGIDFKRLKNVIPRGFSSEYVWDVRNYSMLMDSDKLGQADYGIELVRNTDTLKWRSLEHHEFDNQHKYWYYHPWRFTVDCLREKLHGNTRVKNS